MHIVPPTDYEAVNLGPLFRNSRYRYRLAARGRIPNLDRIEPKGLYTRVHPERRADQLARIPRSQHCPVL